MSNYRTLYLRNEHGFPVACISMVFDRKNSQVSYGYSTLNPVDKFNRGVARHLSLGRLTDMPSTLSIPSNSNAHEISTNVVQHLVKLSKNTTVPTRTIKAAKRWLKMAASNKNNV